MSNQPITGKITFGPQRTVADQIREERIRRLIERGTNRRNRRIEQLSKVLRDIVKAIDDGAVAIQGPLIRSPDDSVEYFWADEWLHLAKLALAQAEEPSTAANRSWLKTAAEKLSVYVHNRVVTDGGDFDEDDAAEIIRKAMAGQ
jgi:hypothetical protein